MSDSVQSSNRKLSDEAKQLEKAGQFAEAADLYKQVHNSYPGIRLIHFADIHLGFTGPTNLVLTKAENAGAAGRYVREVDIEESVKRMTRDLGHAQPAVDMVVIAGDLFHRSVPYLHAISFAAKMIRLLRNYDIPVVIIDGNHETASILLMGSPTAFLRELHAHVINGSSYKVLRDCWSCRSSERQARLSKLAVHALPYRALRGSPDFTGIHPIPGYINVLLAHGRVSGMNQLNSLHHTAYTIPSDVLLRGWDYVAMGDWHIHRYQPLKNVPAFYAGSLEALNFGEAVTYPLRSNDAYALHGALDVRLHLGKLADVRSLVNVDTRPVLRLEPIEAIHADAKTIMDILHVRLRTGLPAHAIVLLEVNNILPQVWGQLDHASTTLLVSVVQWRHEQDPSAESLTRTLTRTGSLPGALCSTVPPTHQPREHGALPHGAAHRSASQDL